MKKHSRIRRFFKIFGIIAICLLIIGFVYEKIAEYVDSKTITPPGQIIEVNGHKIHIYCTGENKVGVPTVIMIPGAGSSYFTFDKIQPALSQFTKVCSYDPSGFGFSEGAKDTRTAQDVASELSELIRMANVSGPYMIVAHSLGGVNAQVFTKDNIANVKSMVLIDPTCEEQAYIKDSSIPASIKVVNWMISTSFYFGVPRLTMTLWPDFFGIHPNNLKIERAVMAKPIRETNQTSILTGAMNSIDQEKQSRNFGDIPISILSSDGGEEQAMEMWGTELANCHKKMTSFSTNAKYVLVKNSSHDVMNDQPQIVIDNILKLLK